MLQIQTRIDDFHIHTHIHTHATTFITGINRIKIIIKMTKFLLVVLAICQFEEEINITMFVPFAVTNGQRKNSQMAKRHIFIPRRFRLKELHIISPFLAKGRKRTILLK